MKKTIAIILLATIAIAGVFATNLSNIDKNVLAKPLLDLANTLDQKGHSYKVLQNPTGYYYLEFEVLYNEKNTICADIVYVEDDKTVDFFFWTLYEFNPEDYLFACYLVNQANYDLGGFVTFYFDSDYSDLNAVGIVHLEGVSDYGKYLFESLDWDMYYVNIGMDEIIGYYTSV